ncbi:MAG: TonB-dependent receptor [Candidatus Aminicenantes bacterium]|nr:TonB-dependent receptor [Candidatus Aminicenantes bacterium]MDH5706412.1 TonB-dependent receptor [Candidatus Aminicenantes bacterium]
MIDKASCVILAVALLFSNLFSQENSEKEKQVPPLHHEITVTATRIETPTREVASSVTVISREELERTRKTTLLQALEEIMGLTVIQNGPAGGAASTLIRGGNSEHTLVLMDGVELNDPISPARSCDLAHVTLENVERIEVLRGPQSTLYGSDALSGVVNIITRKGQGEPRFSFSSSGGTYDTFASNAGVSGGGKKTHYSLGASYFRSDGFSAASASYEGNKEKDGYQNLTLSGRFGYLISDSLELDIILKRIETRTELDNFGGAYGDDPNSTQKNQSLFLKGQIRALLLKNRWEQKFSFSFVDYDRRHENSVDEAHPFDSEEGFFKSSLVKLTWQNNFFIHETNTLTFGIDHQQEQGESEYHSEGIWGPYSSLFPLRLARITGLYFQDQTRLASRFFATAGIRIDTHTQFGTSTTFRIAPAYFVKRTQTKFKATIGTGFKSPSIYQLYAPESFLGPVGNENLNPEKSTGWDIGIEQYLLDGKILFGATYFKNDYQDLIQFDLVRGYTNVGKAESKGMEFFVQSCLGENFSFTASYTRTEAKDLDTDTYLFRRPTYKLVASLHYNFLEKGNINLSFIQTGKRDDQDFSTWPATRVTLPGFTLLNAVASYELIQNIQVFCRIDNLLNEKYEMIKGYGTPGRAACLGLNLSL